ncbi:MAG: ribonuclease activity regulator RraA [Rhodospirillales bacterium]|jgi:regulator of RNase E activity RraA
MSATFLTANNRKYLMRASVASLTTLLFKRGFRNLQVQNVHQVNATPKRMVGEAFTLRYIPAREDLDVMESFQDPEHPQRKAIETCPKGHVMVIDSRKDASGASAGGILITRLMVRGAAGIVTDGGFRDSHEMALLDFPVYHQRPGVRTNLCMNHAVDINVPIACGDVPVFPSDIIVGDEEAVVVLPAHLANEIAEESAGMEDYEAFVIEEVRCGRTIRGLYPASEQSRKDFQVWMAKKRSKV